MTAQEASTPTLALYVVRIGRADEDPVLCYCRQFLLMFAALHGWLRIDKGVQVA